MNEAQSIAVTSASDLTMPNNPLPMHLRALRTFREARFGYTVPYIGNFRLRGPAKRHVRAPQGGRWHQMQGLQP